MTKVADAPSLSVVVAPELTRRLHRVEPAQRRAWVLLKRTAARRAAATARSGHLGRPAPQHLRGKKER